MCGQALHFVREIGVLDDLPVNGLIDHLLAENHLIMAEHTSTHWPKELWLTSPVIDRDNRETWERRGREEHRRALLARTSRPGWPPTSPSPLTQRSSTSSARS